MKHVLLLSLGLFLLNLAPSQAQEAAPEKIMASKASIGLSLGINLGAYREETYANAMQSIEALSLSVHGEIPQGRLLHRFNLFWYLTEPDSVLSRQAVLLEDFDPISGNSLLIVHHLPVIATRGCIDYQLGWHLEGREQLPLWLGFRTRVDLHLQFAHYPSVNVWTHLGPAFTMKWLVNDKNTLSLSAASPLFGWALRPPYAGADALMMQYAEDSPLKILSMGGITSLHNHLGLDSTISWQHEVNQALALSFESTLHLNRFTQPRPRKDVEWVFKTSAVYTF